MGVEKQDTVPLAIVRHADLIGSVVQYADEILAAVRGRCRRNEKNADREDDPFHGELLSRVE
jgi:hypothetical protein